MRQKKRTMIEFITAVQAGKPMTVDGNADASTSVKNGLVGSVSVPTNHTKTTCFINSNYDLTKESFISD